MIVDLAEAACRQIDEMDGLEIARKEATDVRATLKELTNVKEKLVQLVESSSLLGTRLSLKELREVDIPKILREVQVLHKKFVHERERRQVQPLSLISTRLQNMLVKIEAEWKKYAEGLIQPHFDLLEVVHSLPEVREQEALLYGLKNHLQHRATVLPRSNAELAEFDAQFKLLKSKLIGLENLHPEVKLFLRKTYDNKATIADLTDEVIRWCREGEHAKVFQISFGR